MELLSSPASCSSSSSSPSSTRQRFLLRPQPTVLQLAPIRPSRRFLARSLRQEEENGKFFPSLPSKYNPLSPDSSDWDFDDELDVPMVRRSATDQPRNASETVKDKYTYGRRSRTPPKEDDLSLLTGKNKFIVAGIFVLGIGAGIALDSGLNVEPSNVASREVIDRQTPNPDVCLANGMSAMVLDHRLFITFNPFNVFVSQAEVKPGCVLRQSNWFVLESRGLVSSDEVRDCKRNMNTFGFVGDLRQAPEITCVYHSESAENQFLKDPAKAALGDGFQPKDLMSNPCGRDPVQFTS